MAKALYVVEISSSAQLGYALVSGMWELCTKSLLFLFFFFSYSKLTHWIVLNPRWQFRFKALPWYYISIFTGHSELDSIFKSEKKWALGGEQDLWDTEQVGLRWSRILGDDLLEHFHLLSWTCGTPNFGTNSQISYVVWMGWSDCIDYEHEGCRRAS